MNAQTISIEYIDSFQAGTNVIEHGHLPQQGVRLPDDSLLIAQQTGQADDELLLKRLAAIVEIHLPDESFNVGRLAAEAGLCRRQLNRKLRALIDQPPVHFIRTLRLRRAAALIRSNADTIEGIAYLSGFNTPNYFSKVFRQEFGCSPGEYREKFNFKIHNSEHEFQWLNG